MIYAPGYEWAGQAFEKLKEAMKGYGYFIPSVVFLEHMEIKYSMFTLSDDKGIPLGYVYVHEDVDNGRVVTEYRFIKAQKRKLFTGIVVPYETLDRTTQTLDAFVEWVVKRFVGAPKPPTQTVSFFSNRSTRKINEQKAHLSNRFRAS